jgi:hypothetical protein
MVLKVVKREEWPAAVNGRPEKRVRRQLILDLRIIKSLLRQNGFTLDQFGAAQVVEDTGATDLISYAEIYLPYRTEEEKCR